MNKLFKFALAALPMLMLASCANDDDLESENGIAQKTETRYLSVTLSNSTATPDSRGIVGSQGEYDNGTEAENKIKTVSFIFYDSDKQFHSSRSITLNTPEDPENNPRPTNPNIRGFYHCNVPIELTQGQKLPNYVVCIINAVEGSQYTEHTMAEAQTKELSGLYAAGETDQFFGMSNSVYYGSDPVTGQQGVLVMAAPFTTDMLLTESQLKTLMNQAGDSGSENQNDIEDYTINIPVERYAAKVNLDLTDVNITNYEAAGTGESAPGVQTEATTTPIALKFTPKKWAVNATEKTFYFIKSFRQPAEGDSGKPGDTFATLADLNGIMTWAWNNPDHKRSFWARTPGYFANNYPLTSDDVKDNKEAYKADQANNDKPAAEKTQLYTLEYKTWDDGKNISANTDGKYGTLSDYVKETTMKESRLTGDDEKLGDQYLPTASLPAVILLGQYTVGDSDTPVDFYLYGKAGTTATPVVYHGNTKIDGTKNIKDQMIYDQTIVLVPDPANEGKYVPLTTLDGWIDEQKGAFVVAHPSKEVRDYFAKTETVSGSRLRISGDIVTLQLTKLPAGKTLYFYNPRKVDEDGNPAPAYQAITANDLTYVNLLLYQNIGGAHFYKDGMAYFTAPIKHWGWYRTGNENYGQTWDKWDWSKMDTGDFGIVRNHVYTIKIGDIVGLGTGIADPKDPIVPPADKVNYLVHFHVNIQKWAVLPTQVWNW